MTHLKRLALLFFAILFLQSQADCAPMNTVNTSEFGITFDSPISVFQAPTSGSISAESDVLRIQPEEGDELYVVVVLDEQGRPVYLNAQIDGLDSDDSFEIKLDGICKTGKTYRAFAITSGGVARLKFTYTPKE